MVGRQVDEQADAGLQRRREVDLERRALQDMDAARRRRFKVERRHADIAAELHVAPGLAQHVGDQRRRRRFAVGAGDGDERRLGRAAPRARGEQLDIADHFDASGVSPLHRPVRLRVGQRHAGRQDQRGKAATSRRRQIDQRQPPPAFARRLAVVPGSHHRAAGDQRARRRQPGAAEAEQRDAAPAKVETGVTLTSASRWRGRPSPARRRRSRNA